MELQEIYYLFGMVQIALTCGTLTENLRLERCFDVGDVQLTELRLGWYRF